MPRLGPGNLIPSGFDSITRLAEFQLRTVTAILNHMVLPETFEHVL